MWIFSYYKDNLDAYLDEATALIPLPTNAQTGDTVEAVDARVWDIPREYASGWIAWSHPDLPHEFEIIESPNWDNIVEEEI